MVPVVVKFAGAVDPVVHRKAVSEGRSVAPGTSRKLIFRGYLVTITGGAQITLAAAVELGVLCVAAWGVAMIYEQNNSAQEQWRLPLRLRLQDGGGRIPASTHTDGQDDRTGLPQWTSRMNQSLYRNKNESRSLNGTPQYADMDGASAAGYAPAAKLEQSRYGITHTWVGATIVPNAQGQNVIGIGPLLTRYRTLGASLQLTHWSSRGSWNIRLQDDWVSAELNARLLFTGAAWRTAVDSVLWNAPWINLGATPTPWLVRDSSEGGVGPTSSPHSVSRESPLAYRQNCLPGVSVSSEGTLVAAPVARLDDALFWMHGSWEPDGSPVDGYISARSLANSAVFEVGATLVPAAFHPELLLMKFDSAPVTADEQRAWWQATSDDSPDVRYVKRVTSSRDGTYMVTPVPGQAPVPDPNAEPIVDSQAPRWSGAVRVTMEDLPTRFRPGTVAERSSMFRAAIGSWAFDTAPEGYIPLIDSSHLLPHAFGAVYATTIGDEVEFAFAVKALDNALVPTVPTRRANDDEPSAPSEALLAVAKTGLVFVRTAISEPGVFTVSSDFDDVIGPADCEQFGAGMDEAVAFLPQVRFGCVLGTKRVYAVRAVRYERNPYLASTLAHTGVNVPMPYTASYLGRENSTVGGPVFYTDREFGPYPDRSKYEELWFVVDGVKHIVDTRALGGNIEPITEAKYGNGVLDLFRWFGPTVNNHRRQMLGMFSAADESDYELLDFYADEFTCPSMEMNTFAQVSDTDIMFVLSHRRFISASRYYDAVVCRFSSLTGEAHVVGVLPDDGNQQIGEFLALTCYQFEVKNAEGDVVQEPCLILRRGRGDEIGQVLTSTDGGATWELLYDASSTHLVNSLGDEYARNGTPSLGLHIVGGIGRADDPRYLVFGPINEDA